MKKNYLYALLLALLLCGCQESLEKKCQRECELYTKKNCPGNLGDNTIIDSMVFEATSHTIHYYYTLTGSADSVGILSNSDARRALLDDLRNSTITRQYKEADYNFSYTYHSQSRPELVLYEVTLTVKDYK